MRQRLATVYMLAGFLLYSTGFFAQSIPVGQITRQMKKHQSDAVATFKKELNDQLTGDNSNAVTDDAADNILNSVDTATNLSNAKSVALNNVPKSGPARPQATNAVNAAAAAIAPPQPCTANSDKSYTFALWFPTFHCSGSNDAINNFFKVSSQMDIANTVGYLYSPNQSTNQIGSDLFTGTFPQGFQAILSAVATQGSSQPSSTSTSTGSTASVSTAVSRLEQGGDFNVRFPVPILYHVTNSYGLYMLSSPNVGFMVSGLSGQNTITQSTEYNVNVPLEFFAETTSIPTASGNAQSGNVALFVDLRPAAEVVSPAFASAIGLKSNRYFFLGQLSAGLSIAQSIRIGFQYYVGPSQVYQVPSSTGTTTKTGKVGGLHLVVSFTPNKSKS